MAVAGYLGLIKTDDKEPAKKVATKPSEIGDLEQLAAAFAHTGGIIN